MVLESKVKLVSTDSGGVQEETCILGVPCVTLRDNTERPETLKDGSNNLAGIDSDKILEAAKVSIAQLESFYTLSVSACSVQKVDPEKFNILMNKIISDLTRLKKQSTYRKRKGLSQTESLIHKS
jgi:UDP-N-acetylglucosamine 2-epimerase